MNAMMEKLQAENAELREKVTKLTATLRDVTDERDEAENRAQCADCEADEARFDCEQLEIVIEAARGILEGQLNIMEASQDASPELAQDIAAARGVVNH